MGMEFIWETEVKWGHTDAAGFVFYPNYFAWFDEATHHFVGSFGKSSARVFSSERMGLPLLEASIQFFVPLHFGDPIMVSTVVEHVGHKSMELSHNIISREHLIARGREKRAWVTLRDSGPVAMPISDAIRHQFNEKKIVHPRREETFMKLVVFDDWRVGLLEGETVVDITDVVPNWAPTWPYAWMLPFIASFSEHRVQWQQALRTGPRKSIADVRIRAPIPMPSKIIAAPVNYLLHQQEMGGAQGVYAGTQIKTIEDYGLFLKPSSSIAGSDDVITLPFAERRTDHEAEIGIIIGRQVRNITEHEADQVIFGFTGLLDLSVRGPEDRPYRKGFDGFCPIGPWIVTQDEIPDMDSMTFRLWVNGGLRQEGCTKDMIYSMRRLVALASYQTTLFPGDIIASGTPQGVGEVRPGDVLHLQVDGIGDLTVRVSKDAAKSSVSMGEWFEKFTVSRAVVH